jgi:hypothetical protein
MFNINTAEFLRLKWICLDLPEIALPAVFVPNIEDINIDTIFYDIVNDLHVIPELKELYLKFRDFRDSWKEVSNLMPGYLIYSSNLIRLQY